MNYTPDHIFTLAPYVLCGAAFLLAFRCLCIQVSILIGGH